MSEKVGGGWVGQDDDVDTDDQEEDKVRQLLLSHPAPHLVPAVSKSMGGNWESQR